MQQQEFSPRRSKESNKPQVICPQVIFYYCRTCRSVFQAINLDNKAEPACCKGTMDVLLAKDAEEVKDDILIDYKIIGGYDENAVEVFWDKKKETVAVEWVYLKTFTGGQIKYVTDGERNNIIFALADVDAYAYCDEDPCLECTFRCKRGFEIYVMLRSNILIKIPLERMHAKWRSKE